MQKLATCHPAFSNVYLLNIALLLPPKVKLTYISKIKLFIPILRTQTVAYFLEPISGISIQVIKHGVPTLSRCDAHMLITYSMSA